MTENLSPREAELVAEHWAEVGSERVAAVYAEAILAAASKTGAGQSVLEELSSLVRDVLDPMPAFERVLRSGFVSHDEKAALIDRVLGAQASKLLVNFLKVLSRHGRMDLLRAVYRQAVYLYERQSGKVRVEVVTATPLDDGLRDKVAEAVRGLIAGEPLLVSVVDPALIGGLVIRVGDTVYDASVASQLERMRQQIIDRSAHEIQRRRDSVRSPARD